MSAADAGGSGKMHRRHESAAATPLEKLLSRLKSFGRLFLFVGLGCFIGGVIEGRCWYMCLAKSLGRLTMAARLPAIVGLAMPAALASAPAANSMLAASHAQGEIPDSALIAGGMTNSFLAYFSHSARTFYPVIGAIGLPGLLFFVFQIGGEAIFIAAVLLWNRLRCAKKEASGTDCQSPAPSGSPAKTIESKDAAKRLRMPQVLPWKETLIRASRLALALLFRLACISIPLVLAMEWLLLSGAAGFWETHVPAAVSAMLPPELLAVIAAQMGGLVQASAVASGLLSQGLVTSAQVLLAMLAASAIGNPFRTLRRNLPTALAIFPFRIAVIIVGGMQLSRFLVTVAGCALVIFWMQAGGM